MEDEAVTDHMMQAMEESLALKHLDLRWRAGLYRMYLGKCKITGEEPKSEAVMMQHGLEYGRNYFLQPRYAGCEEVLEWIRKAEREQAEHGADGWRKILLAECAVWCEHCAAGNIPRPDSEMRGYSHRFFLRKKKYCRSSEDIEKYRLHE